MYIEYKVLSSNNHYQCIAMHSLYTHYVISRPYITICVAPVSHNIYTFAMLAIVYSMITVNVYWVCYFITHVPPIKTYWCGCRWWWWWGSGGRSGVVVLVGSSVHTNMHNTKHQYLHYRLWLYFFSEYQNIHLKYMYCFYVNQFKENLPFSFHTLELSRTISNITAG